MFVHVGRRAQIAEVLMGRRTASRSPVLIDHPRDLPRLERQSFAAVWSSDPAEHPRMPELLLTADDELRDWLAWLVNFAPTLRPITAFCRVMTATGFARLADAFRAPELGRLESACVGLVLGEVLSSDEVLSRLREPLAASACASALSFALVRELAIYARPALGEEELPRKWARVRHLTRQRERGLEPREVADVADVLRTLLRIGPSAAVPTSPVVAACEELLSRGEVSFGTGAFGPAFAEVARDMEGTREERVETFERVLASPPPSRGSREDGFAIGYLASRISPGTLTHAALVAPALSRYPSAMLWYGVCAGLTEETSVLGELGGAGRRILRELTVSEALLARPRADVSAAELEILLGGERSDDFPVYSASQLTVELVPGVLTVLNWSSRARSRKTQESPDRADDRLWIEYEVGAVINRLADLQRRIRPVEPPDRPPPPQDPGPDQPMLFDRPPYRRGGARKR